MSGVVLVTGASAGLGRATCDLLAERGWTVVGGSRRGTGGDRWEGIVLDVDNDDSVSSACSGVIENHGRIDAVVCAAGFGIAGPVELTTSEDARAQLETNFWGTVRVAVCALPHMRAAGHGRIIVMSSIGGQIGLPFQAYYCASKFALEGWAESLAYEVAPFGIHVTLVQPGNFATDFTGSRRSVTAPLGDYRDAAEHAVGVMERDERNGAAPSHVAAVIVQQLDSRSPAASGVGREGRRAIRTGGEASTAPPLVRARGQGLPRRQVRGYEEAAARAAMAAARVDLLEFPIAVRVRHEPCLIGRRRQRDSLVEHRVEEATECRLVLRGGIGEIAHPAFAEEDAEQVAGRLKAVRHAVRRQGIRDDPTDRGRLPLRWT